MIVPLRHKNLVPPPIVEADEFDQIQGYAKSLAAPYFVADLLIRKGINDFEGAQSYFFPAESSLRECCGIRDLEKAVDLLQGALAAQERIAVHGDYDVDGVSGTALLWSVLRDCGFSHIDPVLPNRFTQGYGLCAETVRELHARGCKWILTVDTGIGAIPEVELANSLGMRVIICDHHQQGDTLPPAEAIVNPNRRECTYAHKQLSGVAVAWKLSDHLMRKILSRGADEYLDFVALGTLADLMPLLDENRYLVKKGLRLLVQSKRPGLRLLVDESHMDLEYPRAQDVLFRITPILNAAGRMGDPELALQFLMSDDVNAARNLLTDLRECNKERRMWESMMVREAVEMVEADPELLGSKVLVVASANWNQGVIGIVAARLIERFHRPVAVISLGEDGEGRASCRSAGGFNWLNALSDVSDLLLRWGGHCHASGFTVPASKVDELRHRLQLGAPEILAMASKSDSRHIYTDFVLSFAEIQTALMTWLHRLEPFGSKNPAPVFFSNGVTIDGVPRAVGGDHLRMRLRQGGYSFDAIAFQQKSSLDWLLAQKSGFSVAFFPVWNLHRPTAKRSEKDIQLQIVAFGDLLP